MEADQQRVRVQAISSMRPSYEGVRDAAGLDLADVFALPDSQAELIGWMIRQGQVSLAEVAQYTRQSEGAARALLEELANQGFVAEQVDPEGALSYEARLATRRGRQGSVQVWQALGDEEDSPSSTKMLHPSRTSGVSRLRRRV